jgi:hypothetical protein
MSRRSLMDIILKSSLLIADLKTNLPILPKPFIPIFIAIIIFI